MNLGICITYLAHCLILLRLNINYVLFQLADPLNQLVLSHLQLGQLDGQF